MVTFSSYSHNITKKPGIYAMHIIHKLCISTLKSYVKHNGVIQFSGGVLRSTQLNTIAMYHTWNNFHLNPLLLQKVHLLSTSPKYLIHPENI